MKQNRIEINQTTVPFEYYDQIRILISATHNLIEYQIKKDPSVANANGNEKKRSKENKAQIAFYQKPLIAGSPYSQCTDSIIEKKKP